MDDNSKKAGFREVHKKSNWNNWYTVKELETLIKEAKKVRADLIQFKENDNDTFEGDHVAVFLKRPSV